MPQDVTDAGNRIPTLRSEQMLRNNIKLPRIYVGITGSQVIYDRGYKYHNWFITLFNSV